jgi:magnesium transporter
MFNAYQDKEPHGKKIDQLAQLKQMIPEGTPFWLDVISPTDEEMQQLIQDFGIHTADVDHYKSQRTRPRTAIHKSYIYFTLNFLEGKLQNYKARKVAFILEHNRLITVREGEIEAFDRVIPLIEEERYLEDGVEFLLYRLIIKMLLGYDHLIEELEQRVEATNNAVEDDKNILPAIKQIRQDSSKLINIIQPESRVLRLLGAHEFEYTSDKVEPYFADLSDLLQEFISQLDEMRSSLNETIEAFTAIQSTEMSKVMQVLTILSTIFLPATLIASIYGMNFKIPEYHWKYGYPYALGLMVVIALGFVAYMKRRGWF